MFNNSVVEFELNLQTVISDTVLLKLTQFTDLRDLLYEKLCFLRKLHTYCTAGYCPAFFGSLIQTNALLSLIQTL